RGQLGERSALATRRGEGCGDELTGTLLLGGRIVEDLLRAAGLALGLAEDDELVLLLALVDEAEGALPGRQRLGNAFERVLDRAHVGGVEATGLHRRAEHSRVRLEGLVGVERAGVALLERPQRLADLLGLVAHRVRGVTLDRLP